NSRQSFSRSGQCCCRNPLSLFLLVWLVGLAACGGGSSSTSSVAGNWQLTLTNTNTGAVKSESGFLLQSGDTVSGNVLLTGQTGCSGVGSALGHVKGSDVSIGISQVGQTVNLTGTSAGTKMSGDYSILSSPCGNSQVGTWTGDQVLTLTGSF